jgi:hypothetical protein
MGDSKETFSKMSTAPPAAAAFCPRMTGFPKLRLTSSYEYLAPPPMLPVDERDSDAELRIRTWGQCYVANFGEKLALFSKIVVTLK